MNSDRIREIQKETAYPESVSVQQALLQVWNECEQQKTKISSTYTSKEDIRREYRDKEGRSPMDMLSGIGYSNYVLWLESRLIESKQEEYIEFETVRDSLSDAADMLGQALLMFTLRDIAAKVDCPERDEAIEFYSRIAKVQKWLKQVKRK